jgi:hypothetical protein
MCIVHRLIKIAEHFFIRARLFKNFCGKKKTFNVITTENDQSHVSEVRKYKVSCIISTTNTTSVALTEAKKILFENTLWWKLKYLLFPEYCVHLLLFSQRPRNFIGSIEKNITNQYLEIKQKSSWDVSLSFEAISLQPHILTMAWKGLKMALHLGLGAEGGLKKAICSASNSTGISPTSDLGDRSH